MNIDKIINSLPLENIIKLDYINPSSVAINNKFIENDNNKAVNYNKHIIVNIMDESCLYEEDNYCYIIYDYNKSMDDVLLNIKCNYKFSILVENKLKVSEIVSNNIILKMFLFKYPIIEQYLNKPYNFSENTILTTLPILFMINTNIKFKIYFNSIEEYSNSHVEFTYECYTFSNNYLKELCNKYKKCKYISNNRGMIFEDGIIKHDFNLD